MNRSQGKPETKRQRADASGLRKRVAVAALLAICASSQASLSCISGETTRQSRIGDIDRWTQPEMQVLELDIGQPLFLRAGDFTEDGKLDLIVAAVNSTSADGGCLRFFLLSGQGGGVFGEPSQVSESPLTDGADKYVAGTGAIADLDRDDHLDVVAALEISQSSSAEWLDPATTKTQILVFWGNGDGTFEKQELVDHPRLPPPNIVAVDFDGNGCLDIAYSDWQQLAIRIVHNRGKRLLEDAHEVQINEKDENSIAVPMLLTGADLNGDGRDDIVVGGARVLDESERTTYRRFIDGILSCGEEGALRALAYTFGAIDEYLSSPSFLVEDLDADGNLDIVFIQPMSPALRPPQNGEGPVMPALGTLSMLRGTGDGSFASPIHLGLCWSRSGLLRAGGDTANGLTVVLISSEGLDMVQGTPPYMDKTVSLPLDDPVDAIVADVDGDGWIEILAIEQNWQTGTARIVILRRSAA